MAKSWTAEEKLKKFNELKFLYVEKEMSIKQVGKLLGIAEQTVFKRLRYFGISSNPKLRRRKDIIIPESYTPDLAEFFGIMLGDGRLSGSQVVVTLGTKELEYAEYVVELIRKVFGARPKIAIRKRGYKDVYLGSVDLTGWLRSEGLVYNKVLAQVDAPKWIFTNPRFIENFIKGFFDTDGSVYRLRWGNQISFNNESLPLLKSIRDMLLYIGYSPSKISGYKVYLTKKSNIERFFREISPKNPKHIRRYIDFSNNRAGT